MRSLVTVAIPTLNAGTSFARTLRAIRAQELEHELELLICDSGSSDATLTLARSHGATVIEIANETFSHGGTRNLMMSAARGAHVAFLTQDAVPARPDWLRQLLESFSLSGDIGLAFGPYWPRADASPSVARELADWFASFTEDRGPRIDRLAPDQRDSLTPRAFLGQLGFFTDANGCVARRAWEQVPFRDVAYAEDHLLARDMLTAGFAKAYVPAAPVIHSHEYSASQQLRRSFDEARAVAEIYGEVPSSSIVAAAQSVRGGVGGDMRWLRRRSAGVPSIAAIVRSTVHHVAKATGTVLGARAQRLPSRLTEQLSLEHRR